MSLLLNDHFLNKKFPDETLTLLTNRGSFLSSNRKKSFIIAIEKFFSEKAFLNESIDFPEEYILRLSKFDLPNISSAMKQIGLPDHDFRYAQLIANVAKVVNKSLPFAFQEAKVYQICVRTQDEEPQEFWGWINKEYVEFSPRLLALCNKERVITTHEISPAILMALQHFQRVLSHKMEEKEVDMSIESLFHLFVFAVQWEIKGLMGELAKLFQDIKNSKSDDRYYKEFITYLEAQEKQLKNQLSENLKEVSSVHSYRIVERVEAVEDAGFVGVFSNWFQPDQPFQSIKKFTDRCRALSKAEQDQFYASVEDFFTVSAFLGKTLTVPSEFKQRFAKIDLPVILAATQRLQHDRKRLIAAIQCVAKQQFLALNPKDRLAKLEIQYGEPISQCTQIGWINLDLIDDTAASVEENKQGYRHEQVKSIKTFGPLDQISISEMDISYYSRQFKYATHPHYLLNTLCFALDHSLASLQKKILNEICDFYHKNAEQKKEMSAVIIRYLVRKDVQEALKNENIKTLHYEATSLSEDELYNAFKFNNDFNFSSLEASPHIWQILKRYQEQASPNEKVAIDRYLHQVQSKDLKGQISNLFENSETSEVIQKLLDLRKGNDSDSYWNSHDLERLKAKYPLKEEQIRSAIAVFESQGEKLKGLHLGFKELYRREYLTIDLKKELASLDQKEQSFLNQCCQNVKTIQSYYYNKDYLTEFAFTNKIFNKESKNILSFLLKEEIITLFYRAPELKELRQMLISYLEEFQKTCAALEKLDSFLKDRQSEFHNYEQVFHSLSSYFLYKPYASYTLKDKDAVVLHFIFKDPSLQNWLKENFPYFSEKTFFYYITNISTSFDNLLACEYLKKAISHEYMDETYTHFLIETITLITENPYKKSYDEGIHSILKKYPSIIEDEVEKLLLKEEIAEIFERTEKLRNSRKTILNYFSSKKGLLQRLFFG